MSTDRGDSDDTATTIDSDSEPREKLPAKDESGDRGPEPTPHEDARRGRWSGWSAMWPEDRSGLSARLALGAFVVLVAGAVPLTLLVFGRGWWFYFDEWIILTERSASDIGDVLRDHNGHPSATPVLIYRALYSMFGLNTYVPYQIPVLTAHIGTVILLRAIMRRSGTGPWVATAAATVLLFFGRGDINIVWGFQIGLVGALFFGLLQFLLADHTGPFDRRDWWGLAAGAFALTFSNVAPVVIVATGLVVLTRRNWRIAAFHTVPLAIVYVLWRASFSESESGGGVSTFSAVADFTLGGLRATSEALGGNMRAGMLLLLLLIGGTIVAAIDEPFRVFRERAAAPMSLLAAGVLFFAATATQRGLLVDPGEARYFYLGAAFALPALAFAGDAIARKRRYLVPLVCIVLLVGVPSNVAAFGLEDTGFPSVQYFETQQEGLWVLSNSPFAQDVPSDTLVVSNLFFNIDIGFILEARAEGKLPDPGPIEARFGSTPPMLALGVAQHYGRRPDAGCERLDGEIVWMPKVGSTLSFEVLRVDPDVATTRFDQGGVYATLSDTPGRRVFPAQSGTTLRAELPNMQITIAPLAGSEIEVCT